MSYNDFSDRRPIDGAQEKNSPGPFRGIVVDNVDPDYTNKIWVQILRTGFTGESVPGETVNCTFISSYWGATGAKFNGPTNTYEDAQKAWGMWVPTPEIGSTVIVLFLEGNSGRAVWIGSLPDEKKNFMVPGIAATNFNTEDEGQRLPVVEPNQNANNTSGTPTTKLPKAVHPLAEVFRTQGLLEDDIRGITTSSARRETPSKVFGISTPGPVDQTAPKKSIGTEAEQAQMPISKLGGSTFVMDDGDNKFARSTLPGEGPPEYVTTGGLDKIPHNELVRLRTRTGHQILLHNSEDIIYIGNAKGTTWIELTSGGKIDIFAEDSVSIHTKNDLNILADRDINLEAKRNVNIKAGFGTHIESVGNTDIISGTDTKITSGKFSHINSGTEHRETAGKIYMNSDKTVATKAVILKTFQNPTEIVDDKIESIMKRVPTHEPYPHHENLNPLDFLKDLTDREVSGEIAIPDKWKLPTISVDTFKQGKG
jgi:hypothetical protein